MKLAEHWQILIALAAAVLLALLLRAFEGAWVESVVAFCRFLGSFFMNLLKMVIVPLVFTSIVVGVAGMGKTAGFARLGFKTLAFYAASSFVAILIGLFMVNTFKPGLVDGKLRAVNLRAVNLRAVGWGVCHAISPAFTLRRGPASIRGPVPDSSASVKKSPPRARRAFHSPTDTGPV